ncbi:MAG: molybdate ABC transporter substrate-binding protein [Actinobacteria bacterium]|nr:molybdate ABC transporter substrate-binding protein [Actinomycetota bacterium]
MGRLAAVALALVAGAVLVAGAGLGCSDAGAGQAGPSSDDSVTLTVSAASDLTLALEEIGRLYHEQTGVDVTFNYGSSGQLSQQIAAGAPVDLFFSANRRFVQELVDAGVVGEVDTALYAIGRITLWTRADSPLRIEGLADLLDPQVKRIAIANPDHAPYGVAAREALQAAGLWEQLQPRIVMAENVLQALQFADSGNADVAIVARSLSVQGDGRWVLVPEDLHSPLEQTLAVIPRSSLAEEARQFADFVNGPVGRPVLQRYGFGLPGEE